MIESVAHTYGDGKRTYVGRLVRDTSLTRPQPGLLIAPAFFGLGPFEVARAHDMAALGYTVLAVDYYGNGKRAADPEEASALMTGLNTDRSKLSHAMTCALDALKAAPHVDPSRTGAMGYCLGGKAVLDLARTGADLCAIASLHGVYDPPPTTAARMTAAALILHGWDDPLADPDAVRALTGELTATCEDWQLLAFGHTGHAFTNPTANAPERGMAYSATATRRSWRALTEFFAEKLAP